MRAGRSCPCVSIDRLANVARPLTAVTTLVPFKAPALLPGATLIVMTALDVVTTSLAAAEVSAPSMMGTDGRRLAWCPPPSTTSTVTALPGSVLYGEVVIVSLTRALAG
jgi:hypothetical protein